MQLSNEDMVLFYNSNDRLGKNALAYAESVHAKVNKQDLANSSLSLTMLRQILNGLGLRPKDIMNKAHPFYQEMVRGHDFDDEGWLNVLKKNPYLIKLPIVFHEGRVYLCESPSEIFRK